MGRWDPDAAGRLQHAALALYLERGYAEVTVAEIAEAAGLTKRTFFRYFADKREVLFAGAPAFQARIVAEVRNAPPDVGPLDAVVSAFSAAGAELVQYASFARARRDLIASSADLQERDLIKMSSLAAAVVEVLRERGADHRQAGLIAHAGLAVFITAYDQWVDTDGTENLPALVQQALEDLRKAVHAA